MLPSTCQKFACSSFPNEQMQTLSSTSPFFPVLQSCRTESVWREEREAELAEKRRAKEMKTPGQ